MCMTWLVDHGTYTSVDHHLNPIVASPNKIKSVGGRQRKVYLFHAFFIHVR